MNRIALTLAAAVALSASSFAGEALAAPSALGVQQQGGGKGKQGGEAEAGRGGQTESRARGGAQRQEGRSETPARGQEGRGRADADRPARERGNQADRTERSRASTRRDGEARGNSSARTERRGSGNGNAAGRGSSTSESAARGRGSNRSGTNALQNALSRGRTRGLAADAVNVLTTNGRVRLQNRRGDVLMDMDENRARELGNWQLRRMGDRQPSANAPAFCRSGAGHPVQGREWCLDKGFGLGSRSGTLWSRGSVEDVIFRRRTDADRLDRGGLAGVLGDIVFGRLALQSVALGYDQPLMGVWVAQPDGPRILRVRSGEYEVAEFVDRDRDDRVEVLYVVQPF
ncbi:MAG TPA: hypothetical protein VGB24_21290 [Longimicrobium sp.]|jgi:hypothetical protein|uniref:hypothetical protein n=1 Tax=Longimicrobium sp. TaxID=2029185 RepID=UPI002ED91CA4